MALKFICRNCNNTIIVQYLKAGEIAKCPHCQIQNVVPDTAEMTDERSSLSTYVGSAPEDSAAITPDEFERINPQEMVNLDGVARPLIFLFWGILILMVCSFVFDFMEYNLLDRYLNGEFITTSEAEANDMRQWILGLIYILVYITASIVFLVWFYRAHKNLYRASVPDIKYKSGWTIGGFFVPILSLFRPFQVMRETQKGSLLLNKTEYIRNWDEYETNPLVGWWWGLFLLSEIVGRLIFRFIWRAETAEQLRTAAIFGMAESILLVPLILVTIFLIKEITRLQDEAKRKAHLGMMGQTTW